MGILRGFLTLLVFQLAGTELEHWLRVPVPGPVIGMVLLAGWMLARGKGRHADVETTADGLLGWLPLLFVPAGGGGGDGTWAAAVGVAADLGGAGGVDAADAGGDGGDDGVVCAAEPGSAAGLIAGSALVALTLTVGAYLAGVWVQRRVGAAWASPVLIAIVLIGLALRVLRVPYATYFSGAQAIHFLLGPATVALAVPLVRAMEHLRRSLWPMLAALFAGALTGAVTGYGLVRVLGGSRVLALSMLPKSLTTPIAIEVSQTVGGLPSLTAVLAILAGVLVAVLVYPVLGALRVRNAGAIGLAAGTAGSGVGASRVIGVDAVSAAFAAVGIGLNGLMTAVIAPVVARVLGRW